MAIKELFGSRRVVIAANGFKGERIFLGDDWLTIYAEAPQIGSPFPGSTALFCESVDFEPYGKSTPDDKPSSHVRVIARYTSSDKTRQQETGRKIDESLEFGGEMLTRAGGYWQECKAKIKKEDIGGTWFPRLVYTIDATVASLVDSEIQKILDATGKVNDTDFLGGPPESWLFEGASARSFYDADGQKLWSLTYRFIYRRTLWNKPYHGEHNGGGIFEYVVFKEEGDSDDITTWTGRLYESTDFNLLLGFDV